MLQHFKQYVPRPVKEIIKWVLSFLSKPELEYLEFHLTDHCNLDCKGCSHYSPLAPPHYADLHQYEMDMQRLKQLFTNIKKIRLMGGEPLLHENPTSFITVTRAAFPKADIRFVTNGILLPKASAEFWNVCRSTNTTIDISVYPPLKHAEDLRTLCKSKHVNLNMSKVIETFTAWHNPKGDSDKQKSFNICRSKNFCPNLKEGRIYTCYMTAYIHYFNNISDYQIEADKGINIHSQIMFGSWILKQLNKPIETCRWCSYDHAPFSWSISNKTPDDWDVTKYKKLV